MLVMSFLLYPALIDNDISVWSLSNHSWCVEQSTKFSMTQSIRNKVSYQWWTGFHWPLLWKVITIITRVKYPLIYSLINKGITLILFPHMQISSPLYPPQYPCFFKYYSLAHGIHTTSNLSFSVSVIVRGQLACSLKVAHKSLIQHIHWTPLIAI